MRFARWYVVTLLMVGCAAPALIQNDDDAGSPEDDVPLEQDAGTVTPILDAGSTEDAADAAMASGLQVFVTSKMTVGNMQGQAGADTICQVLGTSANLGASWVAWLSNEDGPHAKDRLTSAGPWTLPTGELVAADKASLLSGHLLHAIDHDEHGVVHTGEHVWTGTGTDGKYDGKDCDRWTTGTNGGFGNTDRQDSSWTDDDDESCTNPRRLYCFEL